eukprot:Amastigsp_a5615_29.p1 type:complete len:181 gc:universal Amastigsp_a5615_29:859-317(-)
MEHDFSVTIRGVERVGRSAVALRIADDAFVADIDSSTDFDRDKSVSVANQKFRFRLFDPAGQEEFSALRDSYQRASHGFLVVFSLCSRESFDAVREIVEEIHRVKDCDTPIAILGNMCDRASERQVRADEGDELAARIESSMFFEVSAMTGYNVETAFTALAHEIIARHPRRSSRRCAVA